MRMADTMSAILILYVAVCPDVVASLKDLGKKLFAFSKLSLQPTMLL